jgi:hypothetical protein
MRRGLTQNLESSERATVPVRAFSSATKLFQAERGFESTSTNTTALTPSQHNGQARDPHARRRRGRGVRRRRRRLAGVGLHDPSPGARCDDTTQEKTKQSGTIGGGCRVCSRAS